MSSWARELLEEKHAFQVYQPLIDEEAGMGEYKYRDLMPREARQERPGLRLHPR